MNKISRFATIAILAASTILSGPAAFGVKLGHETLDLDFTRPDEVKLKAKWDHPEAFNFNSDGIGLTATTNKSYDLVIETTEPMAVGFSWRTVSGVDVSAKIDPCGKFKFGYFSTTNPPGKIYVRYSPDAKNWSSWIDLKIQAPKSKEKPEQTYSGNIRVPEAERNQYGHLIEKYSTLDVPWSSDEEAGVKWILGKDPAFFEKSIPFIGYLEFKFETQMTGTDRLKGVHVKVNFGTGGKFSAPKDPNARKDREGPWRFKATK